MTRVLIVDDNPVIRMGLRSLLELEDGLEICGEADSGPRAVEAAAEHAPDVVLLDVRMPGGGGLDSLAELSARAKVLMLTYTDEAQVVSTALRQGATGYLVHGSFDSAELATAIRDTAAGRPRLSPAAASVLLAGSSGAPPAAEPDGGRSAVAEAGARFGLSRRELEISEEMVRGSTNSEIAAALFIEEKTVKNHINRLFAKLGVTSRPAAISLLLGLRE